MIWKGCRMSSPRLTRRSWLVAAVLALQPGCGTIFWPERKGQPAGRLDPKVVALDAVGLLFFFVPGVIAFAVDFNNGTIYLPPGEYSSTRSTDHWATVAVDRDQLDERGLEQVLQTQTGRPIRLRTGEYRATALTRPTDLDEINLDDTELAATCDATRVRFRAQSEF